MSSETASVDAETEEGSSVVELWKQWYHVPVLGIVVGFMLWVRLQAMDRFLRDGQVLFSGNDAYYHYRNVVYSVNNWPWTMPFDPWTRYPYGTSADHFGTLFDQIIATGALIVGFGDPSQRTVAMVTLVAPAVFGAFVAVPVYYLGKRLSGRGAGLFGVIILALLPGTFLRRSTVGFADHHVAEVFFQTFAIAAVVVAVTVASRELPVYEQVLDRDWEGLREPVRWSAIAGLAIALYIWAWPPGILLVGLLGIFFAIALSLDFARGRSPEHLAFVGVVSMLVTFLLLVVKIDTFGFGTTSIGGLHFLLTLAVAAGCLFMAGLGRVWSSTELDRRLYPVAISGLILVGVVALMVAAPRVFSLIRGNLERIVLFSQSKGTLTIAEAQSVFSQPGSVFQFFYQQYGLAYVTALFAAAWMGTSLYFRYRAEHVFVLVWTVFTTLMALTQLRFNYYLVVPIAVLNAWLFGRALEVSDAPSLTDRMADIKAYQVLTLLAVLILVLAPLLPPFAVSDAGTAQAQGAPHFVVDAGQRTGPGASAIWGTSGAWLQDNTPRPGTYGGADNPMDYTGTFAETDDHEYPDGAYGVISWWDYGHWITVLGERIPHSNPFQQGPRSTSSFLQSPSEERATAILEALPSLEQKNGGRLDELSTEEIAAMANQSEGKDGEGVRYVMIDDQTAGEKFQAVTQWAGPGPGQYFTRDRFRYQAQQGESRNLTLTTFNNRYRETMLYRLYFRDASNLSQYRLVHESPRYSLVGGLVNSRTGQTFPLRSLRFTTGWDNQTAGLDRQLRQGRQFGIATNVGRGLAAYNAHIESSVKTFERVEGATITGQIDAENVSDRQVAVSLELETNTGRTFQYFRITSTDESGQFSLTVPYSTDNVLGPDDGYTNSSVVATGNYSMFVGPTVAEQFDVSEPAIYDGSTVDLGTIEVTPPGDGNESDGDGTGDGNESDGAGDGESGDGSGGGNESGDGRIGAPSAPGSVTTDAGTLAPPGR